MLRSRISERVGVRNISERIGKTAMSIARFARPKSVRARVSFVPACGEVPEYGSLSNAGSDPTDAGWPFKLEKKRISSANSSVSVFEEVINATRRPVSAKTRATKYARADKDVSPLTESEREPFRTQSIAVSRAVVIKVETQISATIPF